MKRGSMAGFRSAALLVTLGLPGVAWGCPCASAGPSWTALTNPDERFAARATVSYWREMASWDEAGRAYPTPSGVRVQRGILELAVAWRPWLRWEFSLGWGAAITEAVQPGAQDLAVRSGDLTTRARWEPFRDDLSHVAVSAGLRAPVGGDGSGSFAGAVSALGLGTWELSLGAEYGRRFGERWTVTGIAEFAARAPQEVSNVTYTQGLRAALTAMGAFEVTEMLALTASTTGWWESNVWRGGESVEATSIRRWSMGLGAVIAPRGRLRATFGVSIDPWFDGAGTNGTAALRAMAGVWYAR